MRICLFSDVHGNMDALRKMLDAESGQTDLFIFAGDIFGYFYDQKDVIDTIMSMDNLIAVQGNHESNYLSGRDNEKMLEEYGSSYRMEISDAQREYLQKLPEHLEVSICDKLFGVFHGGPDDYLEQRIYPDTLIGNQSVYSRYEFLVSGHTHYQFIKKIGTTTIINPGSLGQPRDGKGFSYCILNPENNECQFKSVNIDMQKLLSQVREIDGGRKVCQYLEKKYGGGTA